MNKALSPKNIKRFVKPQVTTDGAGVRLQRLIGTAANPDLDPFLLLDHFGSENPDDYIAGFPMHPHRGIETVTYMLEGQIRHSDSAGNSGVIESGGVQWMTAGSGIMHEEMPEMTEGRLEGFQLWVNLAAVEKMMTPRYQEFASSEIPVVAQQSGTRVRVIAGTYDGNDGAVRGIAGSPTYLDVASPPGTKFECDPGSAKTTFCYLYKGSAAFGDAEPGETGVEAPVLIVYGDGGDVISVRSGDRGASFLVVAGTPLNEPVSRYGPFVMNTREEIETALDELRDGTFIKQKGDR